MKKTLSLILALLMILTLASCGEGGKETPDNTSPDVTEIADATNVTKKPDENQQGDSSDVSFPYVIETLEYTLYTNIFYNKTGDDFIGMEMTKAGTFAKIRDQFNEVDRYYVWGYYDETKCCDWQWEFVPENPADLPPIGSFVKMTGTFEKNEAALDGYWFVDTSLTVEEEYITDKFDVDMSSMNGTLLRVQIVNLQQFKEYFEGKTVRAYGRVIGTDAIQHPYYDSTFEQAIVCDKALPPIDTYIVVSGTYKDGKIADATYQITTYY
jgi:predicted small lipoprotein YifL